MKSIDCDVLIVGGSGTGLSAAKTASLGAKTIVIEKNHDSNKVACGEALSSYLLDYMPFKIPSFLLKWEIKGIKFYADGLCKIAGGNYWKGYSFERKDFNLWLANEAIKAGAHIFYNTELTDIEISDSETIKKIFADNQGKKIEIKPKIIIAADGVKSSVANKLNLIKEKKDSYAYIVSFEMENLKLNTPHLEQIYFDDFAPKGFAYIFPKSKNTANVGVGSVLFKSKTEEFFEEFCNFSIVKKQIIGGKKTIDRSGYAPIDYSIKNNPYKNLIFVGDAANQNIKPFIEGFLPGIICGCIAGNYALDNIKDKVDTSQYLKIIKQDLGELFYPSDLILKYLLKIFKYGNRRDYLLLLALCSDPENAEKIDELFGLPYKDLRKTLKKNI